MTGHALLGTHGDKHGVSYDYRADSMNDPALAIPLPTPNDAAQALDAARIPTGTAGDYGVKADKEAFGKNLIKIGYTTNIADITGTLTPKADKWVYNPTDGWFYYTKMLAADGGYTELLMNHLYFDASMKDEYTGASYDLVVKMEGIQASDEALKASDGWDFGTAAPGSNNEKIYNVLKDSIE